jgi:aldose 1-epimerase
LELITIEDNKSRCIIAPSIGGSIISWSIDGQNILRDTYSNDFTPSNPLDLASFPLVPYSNRIGNAHFSWAGQPVSLLANFSPEPHAIHGVGWERPWTVKAQTQNMCELIIEHVADDSWPWPFVASQQLMLTGGGLKITSKATNMFNQAVPLAFGHHPYFDKANASLQFHAEAMLTNGTDALPSDNQTIHGMFDFANSGVVAGRDIDHCYTNWDGRALIRWENRPLALEITSDVRAAVIYIPPDGDAFCFEPVPHVNNALNRMDLNPGMPIIAAGESFSTTTVMQTFPAR